LGEERKSGQQHDAGRPGDPAGDAIADAVGEREQDEGQDGIEDEDIFRTVARQVMDHRNEKRLEQRALVELPGHDLEGALDVVGAHGHQGGLLEMHAHGRAEQHHFIHQDLEPVGLVHDQHDAADQNQGGGPARDLAPRGPTRERFAREAQDGPSEQDGQDEHRPVAAVDDRDERLFRREGEEAQDEGRNPGQDQQREAPIRAE
jgi:hypothetical protein